MTERLRHSAVCAAALEHLKGTDHRWQDCPVYSDDDSPLLDPHPMECNHSVVLARYGIGAGCWDDVFSPRPGYSPDKRDYYWGSHA